MSISNFKFKSVLSFAIVAFLTLSLHAAPLKIAYSDWPGWVAWDIGVQKGWFKEAGVEVEFVWFEYVPSMDAFATGKVDAVAMTNGDALVTGSAGAPSVAILTNDYSYGNDMIVAKPEIKSLRDLKGKKIGVELGFVEHLLVITALQSATLKETDVTLVNMPTDQTPQALANGSVDAIAAWQPNSGQALKALPGSKALYTSANVPGLIYDVLAVNPKSLAQRKADWKKVVTVWYRIADYLADQKNMPEALKIMSARVGLKSEEYAPLMKGTFFLNKQGNIDAFKPGDNLKSIYYSNRRVDKFNVDYKVYKAPLKTDTYLDPSLIK